MSEKPMRKSGVRKPNEEADPKSILIGVREVARMANIAPGTVRKMARDGRLPAPAHRLGQSTLRWHRVEMREFLDRRGGVAG